MEYVLSRFYRIGCSVYNISYSFYRMGPVV